MFGEVKVEARLNLRGDAEGRVLFFILRHIGEQKEFFYRE